VRAVTTRHAATAPLELLAPTDQYYEKPSLVLDSSSSSSSILSRHHPLQLAAISLSAFASRAHRPTDAERRLFDAAN